VVEVLSGDTEERLVEKVKNYELTALDAIYRVLEHFTQPTVDHDCYENDHGKYFRLRQASAKHGTREQAP
jgi:hypothetical protein